MSKTVRAKKSFSAMSASMVPREQLLANTVAMDGYSGDEPKAKKKRTVKAVKDPNKPKKALSAFFWFSAEERVKVKAENPDIKFTEVGKELGNRWKSMSDDQKKKYEVMAANDKKRYAEQMEAYKK